MISHLFNCHASSMNYLRCCNCFIGEVSLYGSHVVKHYCQVEIIISIGYYLKWSGEKRRIITCVTLNNMTGLFHFY